MLKPVYRHAGLLAQGCPVFLVFALATVARAVEPVDYIDPFIGTGHFGKTFPGATTPGGMVQLSPDTVTGGDNGSGYRQYHTTIEGFSFTHMSGVGWYGDLGNLLVMPTTGPLKSWAGRENKPGSGYRSAFDKSSEVAQAGYYAVTLKDYQVRTELTAAPHSGILRFTFPEHARSRIQIDLARRVGGTSLHQEVKVVDDHAIEGLIVCTPEGGGWGHGGGNANYTVHFRAEFSQPLTTVGVWNATLPTGSYRNALARADFMAACQNAEVLPGCREKTGQHVGFYTEFPTKAGQTVLLKVGISFVSIAGARENLAAEIPGWDFEQVRTQARQAWSRAVGCMTVAGGTEAQKTAFYTALYHALLDPRIFADRNGEYPGGDGKPHRAQGYTKRTIFSGWDVYRSEFPLLTIIAPEMVNDMINSMVDLAAQNGTGYFDRWEILNAYSGCMNGSPAVTVLNDAYRKGIRGYNVESAYAYAVKTCQKVGNLNGGRLAGTLENGIADWNLAQLAAQLGKTDDAKTFGERSLSYRTLFDPQQAWTYDAKGTDAHPGWQGCFRTKDGTGAWQPWDVLTSHKGCVEGTVIQYSWMAPHDIPGLMTLHGGPELFVAKLNEFFTRTPPVSAWSGPGRQGSNEVGSVYYNHPNEPCHLTPFLFNRAGAPWLTQKWVRLIDGAYTSGPEGLCGDEDVGQMSAWFILAASGLHQACPGDLRFEIFTPLFDRVTIKLDPHYTKGGVFTISATNNTPENVYIQSATLNGKPLNRCWLEYGEIVAGGTLDLVLGSKPNKQWGLAAN